MKTRLKRVTAGFLAFLTVLTALFSDSRAFHAASPTANIEFYYASVRDSGEIAEFKPGYRHKKVLYGIMDGNAAYCMNYGLSADGGQLMNSAGTSVTPMSPAQEKLLGYCLYYGFNTSSADEPSDEMKGQYIATQAMVWVIVADLFGTESGDSGARKLCDSAPDAAGSYAYYEALKNNISNSYNAVVPDYASRTMSAAPVYELKWNGANGRFEMTFNDGSGVAGSYDISAEGYGIERNGNLVTIYSGGVNTAETMCVMQSNAGAVETVTSCVYWLTGKSGYQEFVSERPLADPLRAYFRIRTEALGYGELVKVDQSSGKRLAGAVYGIYTDSGCTNLVQTMTTDGNGYARSGELVAGTYYVKEISAPRGYVISGTVHTLCVSAGQTTGITATDAEQLGSITIYKEGEVLTGWNGTNFTYETRKLPGAVFKVTAGEDIYKADGTKAYNKGDTVAENLKSGSDGQAVLSDLHLGTYVITETKSIDGYTLNTVPQTVKIEYKDQNVTVQRESATIKNTRQKAGVTVSKEDSDTKNPLGGGKYTLYAGGDIKNHDGKVIVKKDTALQTATTGKDGKAKFTVDLPIKNSYYVKETKAPYGYVRDEKASYSFTFGVLAQTQGSAAFTHTFKNERTTAKIQLYKVDKETGKAVPQGDATLKGAVYGLYAREDIVHPDGATGTLYGKDALVATLTTDKKGECSIGNLYLGKYYVKEITPPEGYLLDEEEHDISCSYEGDMVAQVSREATSKEQVIKQPFELIKVSEDGKQTEADLLKGAGFTAYLKSTLKTRSDGTYDFDSAKPVVLGENNASTIYTDNKGYACSIPLPYGTYVVRESVTPHNLETVDPFEVRITEHNPSTPQVWRVFLDREFEAKLRIVKKDAGTKKNVLVPGAEFRIYDMGRKEYVKMITTYPSKVTHTTFTTDGDGDLILPDRLKTGTYRIEEVSAPYGYVVNEEYLTVKIDTDTFHETDPDTWEAVITIECEDRTAEGELTVEKKGEIPDSYTGGLFEDPDEKGFAYKEGSLAGAVFEVYAAEDIFTADMQTDENGNRIKYYAEGEFVASLVTGDDGKASLKGLPLGTYKVAEVKAPYGFVLNSGAQTVTFTYADDHTPVIYEKLTFSDDRQKLSLSVAKKDAENGGPVSGAAFGLYADEDIKNADGKTIIGAGTLLETAVSDENGMISFTKDYPFAKYYAKEIKTPAGYVTNATAVTFDAQYQGQDIPVAEYRKEFLNTPTSFEFTKTDITSGAELSGASLAVLDKDGNTVDAWTSEAGKPHVIKKLVVGQTYTLREEFAPYGYLKASDITFTVEDTGNIQSVEMKDEVPTGTILINKDGQFVNRKTLVKGQMQDMDFHYQTYSLKGVTFEVYAKEDITSPDGLDTVHYHKNDLVAEITTDENGIASIRDLPLGKYYLVETKTAEGFVLDRTPIEADLSYADQHTPVVYAGMSVVNERQKVKITVLKKDKKTQQPLAGALFGLFVKEDIVNPDGEVVAEAGERIETAVTKADGTATFTADIPLGQYYVEELEAPAGYVKSGEVLDVDASYQGDGIKLIELQAEAENDTIKVEFSKTDITGEKELGGARLSVISADGTVVESWTSETGKTHLIERLPAGSYTLREETAPYGYRVANDAVFEVTETADIQKVTMKDEYAAGKIIIEKTDAQTGKPIAGVEFEIKDASGNPLGVLVTDENGHAESPLLPICTYNEDGSFKEDIHYYVKETKAADGYVTDDSVHDVVLRYEGNAPECVEYVLSLANQPVPKAPKTGDHAKILFYAGMAAAALVAGILAGIMGRKKKRN